MASFTGASKPIVIRTSRETLGLVVAASAVACALAGAVHSKHDTQTAAAAPVQQVASVAQDASPQEVWAGHLAELTPAAAPTPAEPMTSASLTVPKAQLALPLPMVPKSPAKPRPCVEPQPCALKALAASPQAAARRQAIAAEKAQAREHRSLIGMLNPLNHLPDMATVSRPFTYAGGAVSGWFKRL